MGLMTCPIQEICQHFDVGKRRTHVVRVTEPCFKWLAMDCDKMMELASLLEYATGEPMACDIDKIRRFKEEFRRKLP